jgi:hypothetical protein
MRSFPIPICIPITSFLFPGKEAFVFWGALSPARPQLFAGQKMLESE